jgi:hypothetical protein
MVGALGPLPPGGHGVTGPVCRSGRYEAAIAELFGEVLALCARSGLVKVGVVAVDGSKIAAAATHHATRSYEQIAREILEEAAEIDAAEDERFGEARGDELPAGLRTSVVAGCCARPSRRWSPSARGTPRRSRVTEASGWSSAGAGCVRTGNSSRHVVSEHAAWHAAGIASDGSRRMAGARHNIKPYLLSPEPAGKINVTRSRWRPADPRHRRAFPPGPHLTATPSAQSDSRATAQRHDSWLAGRHAVVEP